MKIMNQDIPIAATANHTSNFIVGLAAVYLALGTLGIGILLPWYARAAGERLESSFQEMQTQLHSTNCVMLRVSRRTAEDDLAKAEADLAKNPGSMSAAAAKENAIESIADLKQQIDAQHCRQP